MLVEEERCIEQGFDVKEVTRIVRGLSKYAKEARKRGLILFGGTGQGYLRYGTGSQTTLAHLDGNWDGGDEI